MKNINITNKTIITNEYKFFTYQYIKKHKVHLYYYFIYFCAILFGILYAENSLNISSKGLYIPWSCCSHKNADIYSDLYKYYIFEDILHIKDFQPIKNDRTITKILWEPWNTFTPHI